MSRIGDVVYFYFAEVFDTHYRGPFPAILLGLSEEKLAILHVLLTDGRSLHVPNCPYEENMPQRLEQGLKPSSYDYSLIRDRCFWSERPA